MKNLIPTILVSLLCIAGCERHEGKRMQPSLNTVNPATHEPYQRSQPKTTGNPMSDTDSVPDRPGDDETPSATPQVPEERAAAEDTAPAAGAQDEIAPRPSRPPAGEPQATIDERRDQLVAPTPAPSEPSAPN